MHEAEAEANKKKENDSVNKKILYEVNSNKKNKNYFFDPWIHFPFF